MALLANTPLFADANLRAYYKCEDATDSGPNGFTLTNNNSVAFNAAKYNNGADGGTTNTNKSLTTTTNVMGASPFTNAAISLWLRMDTEIAASEQVFIDINSVNGITGSRIWMTYQYNAGTRRLAFNRRVVGGQSEILYNITLGTTNLYHLVFNKSGTSTEAFVNGVSVGTGSSALADLSDSFPNLFNLLTDISGSVFLSGMVDDVGIFNRVLTSTEILMLYNFNAKTVNGLTLPSVKTVNGLAIASIKTWNGLF